MENFLHILAKRKTKILLQNNLLDLNLTMKSHFYVPFIKLFCFNYMTQKKKKSINMINFEN